MNDDKQSLPTGWRWVRLGDLCRRMSNGTTADQNKARQGVPVTRIETISKGNINPQRIGWINSPSEDFERYILRDGDILFSHINSIEKLGNCALYSGSPPILIHGMNLLRLEVERTVAEPSYLFYFLKSEDAGKFHAERARRAIGQASLNTKDLAELRVPLAPREEQKRIATALSIQMVAVEQARAAAEVELEAAKALPAAYLRALFSSPEACSWPRMSMGDLCEIVARQVDPKIPEYGRLLHVNGENIESGTCRLLSVRSAAEDGMTSGKYLFESGNVLYSKLRPYLRKVAVPDFEGLCSADMYPIRINKSLLDPHYTAWMLLSDEFTNYADQESRRARMPKLNREQLFAWVAPVPTLTEQQRIAAMLNEQMASAERARKTIQEELDAINKLPTALLRRAFKGDF